MDPRALIETVLKLWATQDIQSTFQYVAEDVVYALHFDEELAPFAGISHGREAMMDAFFKMIQEFDYLQYEPVILGVEKEIVRVQTRHRYLHRRTGSEIAGSYRSVFTVRDGLVVRCEEYVDRGMVDTFLRLVRARETSNQTVPSPAMEVLGRPPRPPVAVERPGQSTGQQTSQGPAPCAAPSLMETAEGAAASPPGQDDHLRHGEDLIENARDD